jgi:hypothetical protein
MRRLAVLALAGVLLAGCAGIGNETSTKPVLLDENKGLFRGVGIGSSNAEVRERFGEPPASDGFIPLEPDGVKGPYAFSVPDNAPSVVMRYDRIAFILAYDRVFGFITSDEGAVLTRHVGIGDPLARMQKAYPLSCREAHAGEALFGGETTYTLCRAKLANGSQLVVTKDPVQSITILDFSEVSRPAGG